MKPIKRSVAVVIYNPDRTQALIVRRPDSDQTLPGFWGLPAGFLNEEEEILDGALRIGQQKLGVGLRALNLIGEKSIEREKFVNQMQEYEAEIVSGVPKVPQPFKGITQYVEWKWGSAQDLVDTARAGGLCDQIFLDSQKIFY